MILYHGSNVAIDEVNLEKCRPFKDFGQGFYLTTLLDQARAMARRTTERAGEGEPTVTSFFLPDDWEARGLRTLRFVGPTQEWALFVTNNRNRRFADVSDSLCNRDNKYDIVAGPVADDRIVASFQLYLDEFISLDELVERLRYRKLSDQYSFHTARGIALLERRGVIDE